MAVPEPSAPASSRRVAARAGNWGPQAGTPPKPVVRLLPFAQEPRREFRASEAASTQTPEPRRSRLARLIRAVHDRGMRARRFGLPLRLRVVSCVSRPMESGSVVPVRLLLLRSSVVRRKMEPGCPAGTVTPCHAELSVRSPGEKMCRSKAPLGMANGGSGVRLPEPASMRRCGKSPAPPVPPP